MMYNSINFLKLSEIQTSLIAFEDSKLYYPNTNKFHFFIYILTFRSNSILCVSLFIIFFILKINILGDVHYCKNVPQKLIVNTLHFKCTLEIIFPLSFKLTPLLLLPCMKLYKLITLLFQ